MLSQEEIFTKYLRTITNKCMGWYQHYFESRVYKNFKARCSIIDSAIDGKFANQNSFVADVSPMIIRQDYNTSNAFLSKYFENDPLISLRSIGSTPQHNADVMTGILQNNFVVQNMRERTMLKLFDNLSRYGTTGAFVQFDEAYEAGGMMTVDAGPDAVSPYPTITGEGKKVAVVKSVHPLNIMMDPLANFQSDSQYIGFLDTWFVSDLFSLVEDENYFAENVKKAIESCKKGQSEEFWYGGGDSETTDHSRAMIHPLRMWTTLGFDGNEQDNTIYYCEFVHNHLIRCHPAGVTKYTIPLQTGVYYPRPDMWMGNSNLEFKMAYQNLKNWLIGATIESTMKQMDRMILVRRGSGVNVADINARHQMGGIVYYDGMDDPSKLMYPVQFQNTARQDTEWLNREVNQMIQELSPVVNMQNKYNEGGLNNSTLGAAQMQAGLGEVLFNFPMKCVSYFLQRIGTVCTITLQNNLGDTIPFRPSASQDEKMVAKRAILGEYVYSTESTYYTNEKGERIDTANMITTAINWMATQNPAFQGLNLNAMLRDWVRSWKGTGTDIDKYLSAQQQAVPQPAVPGMAPPPPPQQQQQPQPGTGAIL